MGVSKDNVIGLGLAIFSSIFIGSSYIIKKKGLIKAGASGIRAGSISLLANRKMYNIFVDIHYGVITVQSNTTAVYACELYICNDYVQDSSCICLTKF